MKSKIDLEQLRVEIRELNRTKKLYKVLKEELSKLGYWKLRGRGDPVKAYHSRGKHA
ncbi:unnamed protein product, partial [marine sediment metagenome]